MGTILVTGANGYIGGRLVPELLARHYKVRIMVRVPSNEYATRWPAAEIAVADATHLADVQAATQGIDTIFYLIHSLLLGPREFELADLRAAVNFRIAAEEQQVKRIIYLGGLGDKDANLSPHLRSRIRVAQELQRGAVPVTIMRAAIIIGSGSASYEIINSLVHNLPVLPIPYWARTRCQPISIRDVIKYLVGALESPVTTGRAFDIGGDEVLTYEKMMRILADLQHRRRFFIPWPIGSVRLFAYVANLLTPVPNSITRCLLEGSRNEVVCRDNAIKEILPFQTLSLRESLQRAASMEAQDEVHTRWSDASYPRASQRAVLLREIQPAPRYTTAYSLLTPKTPAALFKSLSSIGGREGWFHSNWLWRLRGRLDRILTGVGTSRGRRSHSTLRINDVIDFWRVEDLRPDRLLLLRAEMILPGKAWLQFRIDPEGERNRLSVAAFYHTTRVAGKAYWYACLFLHQFIFKNLIEQIEKRS